MNAMERFTHKEQQRATCLGLASCTDEHTHYLSIPCSLFSITHTHRETTLCFLNSFLGRFAENPLQLSILWLNDIWWNKSSRFKSLHCCIGKVLSLPFSPWEAWGKTARRKFFSFQHLSSSPSSLAFRSKGQCFTLSANFQSVSSIFCVPISDSIFFVSSQPSLCCSQTPAVNWRCTMFPPGT